MKNLLICGWYGTETLGDRAILAGIFKILSNTSFGKNIKIASLYPFLTKRTFIEDMPIYRDILKDSNLCFFDVYDKDVLDNEIEASDLVVFGGGPIMDLAELNIIKYIFSNAKRKGKKTAIIGCGLGPLYRKQYINKAKKILNKADIIIFRDKKSVDTARNILNESNKKIQYSHDPAVLSCFHYMNSNSNSSTTDRNYIAVNLREFNNIGFKSDIYLSDDKIIKLLKGLSRNFNNKIKLVPMHTFGIGGDDRYYLTKLKDQIKIENIEILHKPLNLFELFDVYSNAYSCIGMRYHSIVFQTLLNGNNFILDYTDKANGKISSFLELIDDKNFYDDRYINVLQDVSMEKINMIPLILKQNNCFDVQHEIYNKTIDSYVKLLNSIM